MKRSSGLGARTVLFAMTIALVVVSATAAYGEWFTPEQRLTFNDADQQWPELSGTMLAFYCVNSLGGPGEADDEFDIGLLDIATDELWNLTPNHTAASRPAISGDNVVWVDHGFGSAAAGIYVYNIKNRTTRRLPIASGTELRISGNRVVYAADRGAGRHIYLFDLSSNTERQLTPSGANAAMPDVSGAMVVWQDRRNGLDYEIYTYDLTTGIETRVTTNAADQSNPRISGGRIVWQDSRAGSSAEDIYLYDVAARTERRITDEPQRQLNPVIAGTVIVWQDERSGDSEIYLFDIAGDFEKRVTTNAAYQGNPTISGTRIAYDDNFRPGVTGMDIYVTQFSSSALSITAPSAITYGTSARVTGALRDASGVAAAGKTVRIESSTNKRTWVGGATALTAADGTYVLYSPRFATRRYLRVRFVGDADYPPAVSSTRLTKARLRYSRAPKLNDYTQRYRSTYKVWGYFQPEHGSGSKQIKVRAYRYQRLSNGRYAYVYKRTYTAKTSNPRGSSWTKYTAKVRLPQTGRWRLRAYHAADTYNAASFSAYRKVRVSR